MNTIINKQHKIGSVTHSLKYQKMRKKAIFSTLESSTSRSYRADDYVGNLVNHLLTNGWVSVEFLHAPIPRKGLGSTITSHHYVGKESRSRVR